MASTTPPWNPVYDANGNTFLMRAVGGITMLYRVSPDGESKCAVALSPGTGDTEATLTLEEKLRRERTRTAAVGITSFTIVNGGRGVVYPLGGELLWAPSDAAAPVTVIERQSGAGPVLDARPSPNGELVAFAQDGELWVAPLEAGGGARRVRVSDGSGAASGGTVTHGLADYLAAEEFDRSTGFWWSPDGGAIAFQRTDDSRVPPLRIGHAGAEPASSTQDEVHRYPFAGCANPVVRLYIADMRILLAHGFPAAGAQTPPPPIATQILDLGPSDDIYVARLQWVPIMAGSDAITAAAVPEHHFAVQLINRAQSVLDVVTYGWPPPTATATGACAVRTTEQQLTGTLQLRECTDDDVLGWINVHDCLRGVVVSAGAAGRRALVLWASERSGFQHLYLYEMSPCTAQQAAYTGLPLSAEEAAEGLRNGSAVPAATLLGAISSGDDWIVDGVSGVVEAPPSSARDIADGFPHLIVYFTGSHDGPLERHLYATAVLVPLGPLASTGTKASVPLIGGPPVRITAGTGSHSITMAPDCLSFADGVAHVMGTPPALALWRISLKLDQADGVKAALADVAFSGTSASANSGVTVTRLADFVAGTDFTNPSLTALLNGVQLFDTAGGPGHDAYSGPVSAVVRQGAAAFVIDASLCTVAHGKLPASRFAESPTIFTDHFRALHVMDKSTVFNERSHRGGGSVGTGAAAAAAAAVETLSSAISEAARWFSSSNSSSSSGDSGVAVTASVEDSEPQLISAQAWFDGDVAMVGTSASGTVSPSPPPESTERFPKQLSSSSSPPEVLFHAHEPVAKALQRDEATPDGSDSAPTSFFNGYGLLSSLSSLAAAGSGAVESISGHAERAVAGFSLGVEVALGLTGDRSKYDDVDSSDMSPVVTGDINQSHITVSQLDFGSRSTRESTQNHSAALLSANVTSSSVDPAVPMLADPGTAICSHTTTAAGESSDARTAPDAVVLPPASAMSILPEVSSASASEQYGSLCTPLFFQTTAADGCTAMYCALFLPDPSIHGPGPYPTLVSVYGGPHVQRVKADWATASDPRAAAMRRAGYLVVVADNRGSARRGVAFERALSRRMGSVEVDDQVAVVSLLVAAGLADPLRIGVYGWSYGGYMALLCAARRPDVFAAAVAGAPVTDWAGYDTAYTERYMGTPAKNAAGYAAASVMTYADRLVRPGERVGDGAHNSAAAAARGATVSPPRLLIVHGLIDENVHARHTWRLVGALMRAGVRFEMLPLPSDRHMPRDAAAKVYVEARIREFFATALRQPDDLISAAAPSALQ